MNKQKLELTWIGKEKRPKLEPRILLENPEKSYHAKFRVKPGKPDSREDAKARRKTEKDFESFADFVASRETEVGDIFDNRLIFGDNLLALKALEQELTGKVKCVFIDPPYNTGSAFTHYDDGLEHSIWLSLMRDRLEIIRRLLAEDGFVFIQIDYRESARLKLVLDEVFGINCFRNEIIVGRGIKNIQSQFADIDSLASGHDTIYLYAKNQTARLKTLFATIGDPQPGKWDTFWRGTDRPTSNRQLQTILNV